MVGLEEDATFVTLFLVDVVCTSDPDRLRGACVVVCMWKFEGDEEGPKQDAYLFSALSLARRLLSPKSIFDLAIYAGLLADLN